MQSRKNVGLFQRMATWTLAAVAAATVWACTGELEGGAAAPASQPLEDWLALSLADLELADAVRFEPTALRIPVSLPGGTLVVEVGWPDADEESLETVDRLLAGKGTLLRIHPAEFTDFWSNSIVASDLEAINREAAIEALLHRTRPAICGNRMLAVETVAESPGDANEHEVIVGLSWRPHSEDAVGGTRVVVSAPMGDGDETASGHKRRPTPAPANDMGSCPFTIFGDCPWRFCPVSHLFGSWDGVCSAAGIPICHCQIYRPWM